MDNMRHLAPDVSAMTFGMVPPTGPATLGAMPTGSAMARMMERVIQTETIARNLARPRPTPSRIDRAGRAAATTAAPTAVAEPVVGADQAQPRGVTRRATISPPNVPQTGATSNAAPAEDPVLQWTSKVVPDSMYNEFLALYHANGDLEAWTEEDSRLRQVVSLLRAQSSASGPSTRASVTPPRITNADSAYSSRGHIEEPQITTPSHRADGNLEAWTREYLGLRQVVDLLQAKLSASGPSRMRASVTRLRQSSRNNLVHPQLSSFPVFATLEATGLSILSTSAIHETHSSPAPKW